MRGVTAGGCRNNAGNDLCTLVWLTNNVMVPGY